jgi:hypothetical protein
MESVNTGQWCQWMRTKESFWLWTKNFMERPRRSLCYIRHQRLEINPG